MHTHVPIILQSILSIINSQWHSQAGGVLSEPESAGSSNAPNIRLHI